MLSSTSKVWNKNHLPSQSLTNTIVCGIFVFMTTPGAEGSKERGIWWGGTSARESELAEIEGAVRNLGNMTLRVVGDPEEARQIVFGLKAANFRERYPDAALASVDTYAAAEADRFAADMEPSTRNNQNPLRLFRVETDDGSPVSAADIDDEIRFRLRPGLGQAPVTVEEVVYETLSPTDPGTLLD
jgi:hypothetical protein